MRILFYVLGAMAGLVGLLALFRTFEHLLVGDGLQTTQLLLGGIGLLLAFIWLKRARSMTS